MNRTTMGRVLALRCPILGPIFDVKATEQLLLLNCHLKTFLFALFVLINLLISICLSIQAIMLKQMDTTGIGDWGGKSASRVAAWLSEHSLLLNLKLWDSCLPKPIHFLFNKSAAVKLSWSWCWPSPLVGVSAHCPRFAISLHYTHLHRPRMEATRTASSTRSFLAF